MQIEKLETGLYQANCYCVFQKPEGKALLIDPGADGEHIQSWLKQLHVRPECIFITHGHFDHIGAAATLAQSYRIPVRIASEELDYMRLRSHPIMRMSAGILDAFLAAAPQIAEGLQHGSRFTAAGEEWRCIEVPGHSDHSLCLYQEEQGVLFSGDTLFAGSVGRTDVFSGEPDTLLHRIEERLLVLPESTRVYPGHGPATTIGQERRSNPYCRR